MTRKICFSYFPDVLSVQYYPVLDDVLAWLIHIVDIWRLLNEDDELNTKEISDLSMYSLSFSLYMSKKQQLCTTHLCKMEILTANLSLHIANLPQLRIQNGRLILDNPGNRLLACRQLVSRELRYLCLVVHSYSEDIPYKLGIK